MEQLLLELENLTKRTSNSSKHMIADEHLLVTFNKHYNIPSFVSQVEAQGIQIMVSMTKMDCSGSFVPFVLDVYLG